MARQRMKARGKTVRKMTRSGLVEQNLAEHSTVRVSKRSGEERLHRNRSPDKEEEQLREAGAGEAAKPGTEKSVSRQGQAVSAHGEAKARDAPRYSAGTERSRNASAADRAGKKGAGRSISARKASDKSAGEGKLQTDEAGGYGAKLYEKRAELSELRGDSAKKSGKGTIRPRQKQRLKFAAEETSGAVLSEDGRKQKAKNGQCCETRQRTGAKAASELAEGQKASDETGTGEASLSGASGQSGKDENSIKGKRLAEQRSGKHVPKKHSIREKVYQEEAAAVGKKVRLRFSAEEAAPPLEPDDAKPAGVSLARNAAGVSAAALHREIGREADGNAAVEGANNLAEGTEAGYVLAKRSARNRSRREQRQSVRRERKADRLEVKRLYERAIAEDETLKNSSQIGRMLQKQRIKREYAKAKHMEQAFGTATVGTIDYIKKIGGKVTDFFKENRKVYVSIGVLIGLMLLIMASVSSCAALFVQNTVDYTGISYLSTDEAIREADLYYTRLEAQLQDRINRMESEEPGHEEYRYNIGPIEHDPFILISYLSAKYEIFTFEEVKEELDALFALQYHLETEAVQETVTETRMVRVGESLGEVVTSGYCSCAICCGIWSGGPTASGVYPTANHTIAVDASNPFVPMGTRVIMNGVEYTVEDTGGFASYGVQFDVYYDSHAAALLHGHQTWEAFLADDNGSREVEVPSARPVDTLNVTLESRSLFSLCQERLSAFGKELFSAYNEAKGNLQMFESPFDFNWYGRISSYYGYRIHPVTGENQLHHGLDIGVPAGTSVKAGLTGTVTASSYNDSYGNYVILKDEDGYELRYAHLESRSVSRGENVTKGDEIGKAGSTGTSTGSHLHVEILRDGERINPLFYLETGAGTLFGGGEYTTEAAQRLLEEADRYLGVPYVWGGYSPSGFDCSGFVSYCLTNSGVRNTGRLTAQGLYNVCTPVPESDVQPGDLIFFTGTYNAGEPVTHVGIYVGNGQMIHCGHPVQYASIYSSYWQSHFYAFGRW